MKGGCEVRPARAGDVERLGAMWQALYDHQHAHGMILPLAADARERWEKSVAERLDSPVARVFVAECAGRVAGFLSAQVKRLPPMYDPSVGKSGVIAEIFVEEEARGQRVGDRLVSAALAWFEAAGAGTVELQVVPDNPGGLRFWERHGWRVECHQLRREIPSKKVPEGS